jgi:predicted ATPase
VQVWFDNEDATYIPFDVIRSYDRPLVQGDFTARMADPSVRTEIDWQIYLLQRRYLDYQVNIGNQMIAMLSGSDEQRAKAGELAKPKIRFQDMMDSLFSYTAKHIDRQSNELSFKQYGETITPYQLSAGEKHVLVILLTALLRCGEHSVLFMDEPEASLHIEWQEQLIGMIRELNPNIQLILTTHSPAVIMHGWMDAVTEVSEIAREIEVR